MRLPRLLTKERTWGHRVPFMLAGTVFLALASLHIWRQNWDLVAFLGTAGVLSVLVGALLKEAQLQALTTAFILANVVGALIALIFGGRVQ